jgi:hypothetical protein
MLGGLVKYCNDEAAREEAARHHRAAWNAYQQLLEEEVLEQAAARLLIVRAGFAAALLALGDIGELIDVEYAFRAEGIEDRVLYLQENGNFESSAKLGANLAATFLDNLDRRLFELLFPVWRRENYVAPKKQPPTEGELRATFSELAGDLGELVRLMNYEEPYCVEIEDHTFKQEILGAMQDTVARKREKRVTQ